MASPTHSARGSVRSGSRTSPAILVTSHQPPNEKNAATNAPATAPTSGGAPGCRATNGTKWLHAAAGLAIAPSVRIATSSDLEDGDRGQQAHAEPDARDVYGGEGRDGADGHEPRGHVAERDDVGHVTREPGRQGGRDSRVHHQQALPAVEKGHSRPVRLAQVDVAAAGLRDSAPPAPRSRARRRWPSCP